MKITTVLMGLGSLSIIHQVHSAHYDYVTSIKVNQIELNAAVSAEQVSQLIKAGNAKTQKIYSECTGNYEYGLKPTLSKNLSFEIFAEDNPQIKDAQFYKSKSSFQQLGQTKGRVWLTWNNTQEMNEKIVADNVQITAHYTLQQFKQDFKHSAQTLSPSGEAQVLILERDQVNEFIKHPQDFSPPYTASLNFSFKNGKLAKFSIQQALAC
ncbi:hypothetical protein [Acinetobacter kanungonis]|uniref:hypothetical protein n=1 Tax=Acinetobacter kanungonis TaxID=2699469 RepID=UPI00137B46A4|nr:hypothetical protein [Acinetobacter kanungonis]NCI77137.1 hypothetical protein [Acinetobacter kanungonis]